MPLNDLKASLVACRGEQCQGHSCICASLGVSAKHGKIPNAYVKVEKDKEMEVYLRIPQGMDLPEGATRNFGVESEKRLALRLVKSLYGLKQAGRLWSRLLHDKLMKAGFTRCTTDMRLYFKLLGCDMTVVSIYVDDFMVTASSAALV